MMRMFRFLFPVVLLFLQLPAACWGFYGHRKINYTAVFLLPPQMLVFYKKHIDFLAEHAVDPDKRRYAVAEEGPRHYIDLDYFGTYPFDSLPRSWKEASEKYSADTLEKHGVLPWWLLIMQARLTKAFTEKNAAAILKLSAEIGHYLADAHVPLHTSSNHDGQYTGQRGIHGFWESRVPELLAEHHWDFLIGKADYIVHAPSFIWSRILESAAAVDSVLQMEKDLTARYAPDQKFAFEERAGKVIRQYSSHFTRSYDTQLAGMIERRMRQSVYATASFWYTAWINGGQPDLAKFSEQQFSPEELQEFEALNAAWKEGSIKGREH